MRARTIRTALRVIESPAVGWKGKSMKKVALPLSRLSFAQKLDLMETLWADMSRDEKKFESPAWYGSVLKEREEAYAAGKLTASEWGEAKKRIKKKVS
jgi:hypothetical protein